MNISTGNFSEIKADNPHEKFLELIKEEENLSAVFDCPFETIVKTTVSSEELKELISEKRNYSGFVFNETKSYFVTDSTVLEASRKKDIEGLHVHMEKAESARLAGLKVLHEKESEFFNQEMEFVFCLNEIDDDIAGAYFVFKKIN